MRPFSPLLLITLTVVGYFATNSSAREAPKGERLEYLTPAGVTYIVTAEGLSEVRRGDRVLARGGWRFRTGDDQWGFPIGPDSAEITTKSLEVTSPTEARVTHLHVDVAVRHVFTFVGEDVRIESYVENRHSKASIQVAAFEGPKVLFGRAPHGILPYWHTTYTIANGVNVMHPYLIRIGGSYGIGDGFGVGAAPHDAGVHPTALLWGWDWRPDLREADPNRTPNLCVHAPIPPRGARTFGVTFRFSPNTDWHHLLDPYRQHLHATVGAKLLYERSNHLPLIQGVMNASEAQRSPANPYAFHSERRLDTLNGVINYHARIAPDMRAISAQGLIIWAQGGLHPRGAMYRPDFDVLPPEVAANMPRLAGMFREQGMRFGVTARPGEIVQPLDWTRDTVSLLCARNSGDLAILTRRFTNMIQLGADLFYLDSAGNRLDDVTILRAVRSGVGDQKGIEPRVQTYVEHPSDVIIPFSGLFPVLAGSTADGSIEISFAPNFWLRPPDTPSISDVFRYFYPDVPIVSMLAQVKGTDTEDGRQKAVEYCYRNRLTPMIIDYWLGGGSKIAQWLPPLTRKYLTPEGQWKANPG